MSEERFISLGLPSEIEAYWRELCGNGIWRLWEYKGSVLISDEWDNRILRDVSDRFYFYPDEESGYAVKDFIRLLKLRSFE